MERKGLEMATASGSDVSLISDVSLDKRTDPFQAET